MELEPEQNSDQIPKPFPTFTELDEPKIVIQSQFKIKDMVIATSFIAAGFAVCKAFGLSGTELLAGAGTIVIVCSLTVLYIENSRRTRHFYNDRF